MRSDACVTDRHDLCMGKVRPDWCGCECHVPFIGREKRWLVDTRAFLAHQVVQAAETPGR